MSETKGCPACGKIPNTTEDLAMSKYSVHYNPCGTSTAPRFICPDELNCGVKGPVGCSWDEAFDKWQAMPRHEVFDAGGFPHSARETSR